MRVLFIESHKFTEQVTGLNAQEAVWELENELLQNPDKGDLVQGTGGFRKIRMKLAGRGKAQALRVVYFHLKDRAVIFLFLLYTKSGQSDLTAEQAIDRHAYPFPQLLPTSFLLNLTHTTLPTTPARRSRSWLAALVFTGIGVAASPNVVTNRSRS